MATHYELPSLPTIESESKALAQCDLLSVNDLPEVSLPALALAIFRAKSLPTQRLVEAAAERVRVSRPGKSTFVPIFTTNYCDSECRMCGMRRGNSRLIRKFAGKRVIEEQLLILRDCEHVRGVGFLTGEFEGDYVRKANAFLTGWAIHTAVQLGFDSVYYNIGSMESDEIKVLSEWFDCSAPVTMCVFQETYDHRSYTKFMGEKTASIPKSDFDHRIASFDHWLDAGFERVNPGVLVGLHAIDEDLAHLVHHVVHLRKRGADVRMSLPRLRPALGVSGTSRVSDDDYLRAIATIALVLPQCPLVLTTRETQEFQDIALPLVGIISPGSPDVAPYKRDSEAANDENSSQFLIPDLRRPREILGRIVGMGYTIQHFVGDTLSFAG